MYIPGSLHNAVFTVLLIEEVPLEALVDPLFDLFGRLQGVGVSPASSSNAARSSSATSVGVVVQPASGLPSGRVGGLPGRLSSIGIIEDVLYDMLDDGLATDAALGGEIQRRVPVTSLIFAFLLILRQDRLGHKAPNGIPEALETGNPRISASGFHPVIPIRDGRI